MKHKEKKYTTKNGQEVVIRCLHENEAKSLLSLKLSYIEDAQTIPISVDEYRNTELEEKELIRKYNARDNHILLVAVVDSQLIGNIDLTGSERKSMYHTGMIGMGIQKNWRNQGVGTFLMNEVIDWAKHLSMLEILWLDVYANNDLGFNLYKKMGFKLSGIIEQFFKEGNTYYDKVQMSLDLKEKRIDS